MKIVYFTHSLISCWNHGNAHFVRGVMGALISMGHDVAVYEPMDSWSRSNMFREPGEPALGAFNMAYPALSPRINLLNEDDPQAVDAALQGADIVLVHEWNKPALVAAIGQRR